MPSKWPFSRPLWRYYNFTIGHYQCFSNNGHQLKCRNFVIFLFAKKGWPTPIPPVWESGWSPNKFNHYLFVIIMSICLICYNYVPCTTKKKFSLVPYPSIIFQSSLLTVLINHPIPEKYNNNSNAIVYRTLRTQFDQGPLSGKNLIKTLIIEAHNGKDR